MLVSVGDVAAAYGVDRKTVRKWERAGDLPKGARTPGNHLRWPAAVIAEKLRAAGYEVPASWGVPAVAA